MDLSADQQLRYARHLALPDFGEAGQARVKAAAVLVIGLGGLGSPAAFYLAAAGVGRLGLMDFDRVALSNLQRQILHATPDLGQPKVESAARRLRDLNPDVELRLLDRRFTVADAASVLQGYAMVLDATDSFGAKGAIAEACHAAGVPYVHAGILAYQGQVLTVLPGRTACYRCVFEGEPPPPAVIAGPLGPVPGVIGAIEAMEAIKFVTGIGELLTNRLLTFEARSMRFREIKVARRKDCPLCGG